jgi:hypothetical protein
MRFAHYQRFSGSKCAGKANLLISGHRTFL